MKQYTFIDYATQGYVALVALIILFLHDHSVPMWGWLVTGHLVVLAAVHGLIQWSAVRPANKTLDLFRHFYPVLLYTGLYRESGFLSMMRHEHHLDAVFIHWDQVLFGFQPSQKFMLAFPSVWVSELFYAAYFSYYVMIGGVGLALFFRNRRQFYHYVTVVSFVFYTCYLIYIFLPVVGPRIIYTDIAPFNPPPVVLPVEAWAFPESATSGPFHALMKLIYRYFETEGAAFPSSHVAISLVTTYFSFLYLRRIRWIHLIATILLCLSTVYCRYHYAVDVFGGAVLAACMVPLANWLYRRFGEEMPVTSAVTESVATAPCPALKTGAPPES
jgi:membrane-associated phospholipid phosphatase